MTDTAPVAADPDETLSVPVVDSEPDPDEGADAVELVRTGWVRLRWGATTFRLRRPFFGELRTIRAALEDMADAIAERSEETQVTGRKIVEENDANTADETLDEEQRAKVRSALTKRSKIEARALTAFCDDQRIEFWRQVAKIVGVDGDLPDVDELPSWIADPQLPGKILAHWRSVPLGRG